MRRAFTFIELMISAAIIALLIAMFIPNHMRQKMLKDIGEKYNIVDVELFCRENNYDCNQFGESEVLQKRFKDWLEKNKKGSD